MSKRQEPWPRCGEDGCPQVVRRDVPTGKGPALDERCEFHKISDTLTRPEPEPVVYTEEELQPEGVVDESPADSEPIASLREALRDDLMTAEVAGLVRDSIVDALRASKSTFITCERCHKRTSAVLPDLGTRMTAAVRLVEELEGKLVSAVEAKLSTEQRRIEARQSHLAKVLDVDLQGEIERLAAELDVDPNSPPDPKFNGFSTEDLTRFTERLEGRTE
jgi:hypothetical protein